MHSRRHFLRSMTGVVALFVAPLGLLPEVRATNLPHPDLENVYRSDVVKALEKYVVDNPGKFSWQIHNELRHEYLAFSEDASRMQSDILLQNSVMDSYVLHTLSDWHIDKGNIETGIKVLMDNAERYGHYIHVKAACLLYAAIQTQQLGNREQSKALYRQVLNIKEYGVLRIQSLEPYYARAEAALALAL